MHNVKQHVNCRITIIIIIIDREVLLVQRTKIVPPDGAAEEALGAFVADCLADSTVFFRTALAPSTLPLVLTLLYLSSRLFSGETAARAGTSVAHDATSRAVASDIDATSF